MALASLDAPPASSVRDAALQALERCLLQGSPAGVANVATAIFTGAPSKALGKKWGPAVSHDKSASEYVLAGLYSAAEAVVRLLEEAAVVDQEDGAETSPMLGSSIDGNRVLLQRILRDIRDLEPNRLRADAATLDLAAEALCAQSAADAYDLLRAPLESSKRRESDTTKHSGPSSLPVPQSARRLHLNRQSIMGLARYLQASQAGPGPSSLSSPMKSAREKAASSRLGGGSSQGSPSARWGEAARLWLPHMRAINAAQGSHRELWQDAQRHLQTAIKMDRGAVAASFALCDAQMRVGDTRNALAAAHALAGHVPLDADAVALPQLVRIAAGEAPAFARDHKGSRAQHEVLEGLRRALVACRANPGGLREMSSLLPLLRETRECWVRSGQRGWSAALAAEQGTAAQQACAALLHFLEVHDARADKAVDASDGCLQRALALAVGQAWLELEALLTATGESLAKAYRTAKKGLRELVQDPRAWRQVTRTVSRTNCVTGTPVSVGHALAFANAWADARDTVRPLWEDPGRWVRQFQELSTTVVEDALHEVAEGRTQPAGAASFQSPRLWDLVRARAVVVAVAMDGREGPGLARSILTWAEGQATYLERVSRLHRGKSDGSSGASDGRVGPSEGGAKRKRREAEAGESLPAARRARRGGAFQASKSEPRAGTGGVSGTESGGSLTDGSASDSEGVEVVGAVPSALGGWGPRAGGGRRRGRQWESERRAAEAMGADMSRALAWVDVVHEVRDMIGALWKGAGRDSALGRHTAEYGTARPLPEAWWRAFAAVRRPAGQPTQ